MPSSRDSFRRNRVAPIGLLYFSTPYKEANAQTETQQGTALGRARAETPVRCGVDNSYRTFQ